MGKRRRIQVDALFSQERLLTPKGPFPLNDEERPQLVVVDEGVIEQYSLVSAKKQTIALHYAGEGIVHWFPGMRLRGMTSSKLRVAEFEDIDSAAAQSSHLASMLRMAAQRQLEHSIVWLHVLAKKQSDERTAHFLCEHTARLGLAGSDQPIKLPKQNEIADILALTNVHVNRTLKSLQETGLIERRRSKIVILNWQGLAQLGRFSPVYLDPGI